MNVVMEMVSDLKSNGVGRHALTQKAFGVTGIVPLMYPVPSRAACNSMIPALENMI